jgi:catalase
LRSSRGYFFAETEHAAFDPGHFVPGIGPSPDRMLQARLFGYGDAHRYRLGINHTLMPVNSPKGVPGGAKNYGRDGAMPVHAPNGRVKNYEPNSFDGPVQTNQEPYAGIGVSGASGHYPQVEMVSWLLAHGASPDARDAGGLRAIDVARAMNANDVVVLLSA